MGVSEFYSKGGDELQDVDFSESDLGAAMLLANPNGLRVVLYSMLQNELDLMRRIALEAKVTVPKAANMKLEDIIPEEVLHDAHEIDRYAAVDVAMANGLLVTTCCVPDCYTVKTNGHWDPMLDRHKKYKNPTESYCPDCEAEIRKTFPVRPLIGIGRLRTDSHRSIAQICDSLPNSSELAHIPGS